MVSQEIYDNAWYGLSNYENYYRWNVLKFAGSGNQTEVNAMLAFKSELRTYFGLNTAQVEELATNWN